jgi:hypothetical protein
LECETTGFETVLEFKIGCSQGALRACGSWNDYEGLRDEKRTCYRLCPICLAGFDNHGILYVVDT